MLGFAKVLEAILYGVEPYAYHSIIHQTQIFGGTEPDPGNTIGCLVPSLPARPPPL